MEATIDQVMILRAQHNPAVFREQTGNRGNSWKKKSFYTFYEGENQFWLEINTNIENKKKYENTDIEI